MYFRRSLSLHLQGLMCLLKLKMFPQPSPCPLFSGVPSSHKQHRRGRAASVDRLRLPVTPEAPGRFSALCSLWAPSALQAAPGRDAPRLRGEAAGKRSSVPGFKSCLRVEPGGSSKERVDRFPFSRSCIFCGRDGSSPPPSPISWEEGPFIISQYTTIPCALDWPWERSPIPNMGTSKTRHSLKGSRHGHQEPPSILRQTSQRSSPSAPLGYHACVSGLRHSSKRGLLMAEP